MGHGLPREDRTGRRRVARAPGAEELGRGCVRRPHAKLRADRDTFRADPEMGSIV